MLLSLKLDLTTSREQSMSGLVQTYQVHTVLNVYVRRYIYSPKITNSVGTLLASEYLSRSLDDTIKC